MLAGIAGRGIPCVYVYRVAGDWGIGPGPYGSLRRADNGGYFSGLSVARGQGGGGACFAWRGKWEGVWTCSCWEKGNFLMINEFKYGQAWNIWPSPLGLLLYNPFKSFGSSWRNLYIPCL